MEICPIFISFHLIVGSEYNPDIMKSVYRDSVYEIFEYTAAYPRAYLASGFRIAGTKQDLIDQLYSPETDRRQTLVLEDLPEVTPIPGDGEAQIVSYEVNSVSIKTSSQVPKLLLLSDTYDPGWQAYLDGNPVSIHRADYVFRAVAVPAGNHTVQFKYNPTGWRVGRWISLAAFVILLVMGVHKIYESRHL